MGQHVLGYNQEAQSWTGTVTPAVAAIQENEYVYVWAEGVDRFRSDYDPVKVGWDFTDDVTKCEGGGRGHRS